MSTGIKSEVNNSNSIKVQASQLTPKVFLNKLNERVSTHSAKMLLDAAMFRSGLRRENLDVTLSKDQAKELCLELIKKGGPAFQVGQMLYREM